MTDRWGIAAAGESQEEPPRLRCGCTYVGAAVLELRCWRAMDLALRIERGEDLAALLEGHCAAA